MKIVGSLTLIAGIYFNPYLPAFAFNPSDLQQLLETNDCEECDLSYADLSGQNLSSANLRKANLVGANLRGSDLSNADLSFTNLRLANLTYMVSLANTNFNRADIRGASFAHTNIQGANFQGSLYDNLTYFPRGTDSTELKAYRLGKDSNLSGADLTGIDLIGTDLSGSDLSHAKFDETTLFGCISKLDPYQTTSTEVCTSLKNINFSQAELQKVVFRNLDLTQDKTSEYADYNGINRSQLNFIDGTYKGENITYRGLEITNAIFDKANLEQSDFTDARIDNGSFKGANLIGTIFDKASLIYATFDQTTKFERTTQFIGSELSFANFSKTQPKYVDFSQSSLIETNFSQANVTGANFNKLQYASQINFSSAILKDTTFRETTIAELIFNNADLREIDLTGAKDLSEIDLNSLLVCYKKAGEQEIDDEQSYAEKVNNEGLIFISNSFSSNPQERRNITPRVRVDCNATIK